MRIEVYDKIVWWVLSMISQSTGDPTSDRYRCAHEFVEKDPGFVTCSRCGDMVEQTEQTRTGLSETEMAVLKWRINDHFNREMEIMKCIDDPRITAEQSQELFSTMVNHPHAQSGRKISAEDFERIKASIPAPEVSP